MAAGGSEDLDPGPVRRDGFVLMAAAPEHPERFAARNPSDLSREACLADPRLSRDEKETSFSRGSAVQCGAQLGELTGTSDKGSAPVEPPEPGCLGLPEPRRLRLIHHTRADPPPQGARDACERSNRHFSFSCEDPST